jgi:hypothetical protein
MLATSADDRVITQIVVLFCSFSHRAAIALYYATATVILLTQHDGKMTIATVGA